MTLTCAIDFPAWVLNKGSRWQVWPGGGDQPWQLVLKRSMGCPATAPVVVRELWHARGNVSRADLEGLVSARLGRVNRPQ